MTFCEAAAFGVPSVTTAVGGIPTIVRHGETGFALPAERPAEDFADVLEGVFADPKRYREFAFASAADYRSRLNWEAFGRKFCNIICEAIG
jgi:glycosyltransferase involved in cell wall biosynthesis